MGGGEPEGNSKVKTSRSQQGGGGGGKGDHTRVDTFKTGTNNSQGGPDKKIS